MTTGNRIKEERERLGYSQEAFATTGAVSKRSQIMYEQDKTDASATYFTLIAAIGADVNYILTGVRAAESVAITDPLIKMTIEVMQGMTKKQKELIVALFKSEEQDDRKIAA